MQEYRFSEENAKKTIKSQMILKIPIILVALLGGFFIANSQNGGMIFGNFLVLTFVIIISGIAVSIGLIFGIKNGTKMLMQNNYKLTEIGIERTTPSGKIVNIYFDKVDNYKSFKKGLFIKAKNQKILIPAGLDKFDELSELILERLK